MKTAILSKVFSDRSLHEACTLAAEIGYDGIEPIGSKAHLSPDTSVAEARDLRAHLDDLDLDVPCLATYGGGYVDESDAACEAELEDLRQFCELATVLDAPLIRHGPGGPGSYAATDDQYETAAAWFREAADVAASYDLDLGVEIHSNTLVESSEDALRFFDLVDRDNVGAIHDAANMYISHVPHGAESIRKLGDWLTHVHVKDERAVESGDGTGRFELRSREGTDWYEPTLLGDGDVDHGPVVAALTEVGYDGFLTDECHVPTGSDRTDRDVAAHEHAELEALLDATTA